MMMQMQSSPKVRTELEFFGTGTICILDGSRKFDKINDGWAVVGYCYRVNNSGTRYISPIIVTAEPDVATLKYTLLGTMLYYNVSFTYEGKTYYVGQWDYSVTIGGTVEPSTLHFIRNGEIFNSEGESAVIKAGRALLDYYYYKTEV
jgi:hypothetical protein